MTFDNHDDLFHIFDIIQSKRFFDEEQPGYEFALGLKLFTEVLLKNRQHPLFEELKPAITDFMKKLKSQWRYILRGFLSKIIVAFGTPVNRIF